MTKLDGCIVAKRNELQLLKALHKYGWLRTRDIAAAVWMPSKKSKGEFQIIPITITPTALRMAQRTLGRLRIDCKVIRIQAPDSSWIYGLSEAGARQLICHGIPAKSGKDQIRRVSLSYYHHRRLANEVAILAKLQGYRVNSELEISSGQWLGGIDGILDKKPDVFIRDGKCAWWVEVERSRRNQPDYNRLLNWLNSLWPDHKHASISPDLPGEHTLTKVVFVCSDAFMSKLAEDLKNLGWDDDLIQQRILPMRYLYLTGTKFIES
jgi:hypothetical protein